MYQEEIEHNIPNIENELETRLKAVEKKNQSLQGIVNELKGRVLEWTVYRELNKSRNQPIKEFSQRFRPIKKQYAEVIEKLLTIASQTAFDQIWINHYIQLQGTTSLEVDVLAEGANADSCYALVFEMKNRDEKNLPSIQEAQRFVANISMVKKWLRQQTGRTIKFVCPIYLSAEGFTVSVEEWLQEHGVLTTDWVCWGR